MKKVLLVSALATIAMTGCQPENSKAEAEEPTVEVIEVIEVIEPVEVVEVEEVIEVVDVMVSDSARTSLDWNGMYRGVLPCEDCEGMEVLIELKQDGTYALSRTYIGMMGAAVIEEGSFSWNELGNTITLADGAKFFVAENQLWLLDADGQRVMGDQSTLIKEM